MPLNAPEIKLDPRLSALASLVRPGKTVLDVGTDHALLPCFLARQGKNAVFASDINPNPLKAARETLSYYGAENSVKLFLSDGLKNTPPADDIIIAGMGGETIAEIIAGCNYLNGGLRLILQPMTRHAELRRGLYRLGFFIAREIPVHIKTPKKIYTVIHAEYSGIPTEITPLFAETGKQSDPLYIRSQYAKALKKSRSDPSYIKTAELLKEISEDL